MMTVSWVTLVHRCMTFQIELLALDFFSSRKAKKNTPKKHHPLNSGNITKRRSKLDRFTDDLIAPLFMLMSNFLNRHYRDILPLHPIKKDINNPQRV